MLARGRLDGLAQRLRRHRAEQEQAALDQHGHRGEGGEVAGMVGSQGEDDAPALGVGDQSLEEPTTLVLVLAQGEGLLGLVDEHDRVRRTAAAVSASTGWRPGVSTTVWVPSRRRAAASPARSREDFPLPDGPTTANSRTSASRSRQLRVSCSRPKNDSASSSPYAASPGYGETSWRAGVASSTANAGSWRRIACSSATRSGPGSSPRSRARTTRTRRRVRNASIWRPARYCAWAEQRPTPLPERCGLDHRGGLGQDLRMVTRSQRRLHDELLEVRP